MTMDVKKYEMLAQVIENRVTDTSVLIPFNPCSSVV